MRFIVDAQLPPALARMLSDLGHTAEHVDDSSLRHADDSAIWNYALEHRAAIITKDEDFPHRQGQSRKECPVIIWLRVGNTSRRALLKWFKALLPDIESHLGKGDHLIEVK